jgi:hypothetical protein
MKTLNILYHMARADFLERTRRYSFLVMLGLVLYLGYLVNIGQITLRLDSYRGLFNSAWVGSMMALVVNFLLGWFGFYLVKNAIARDYNTGVGQIIATTTLSRPLYLLGKWISNFLVLDVLVFILMLAAVVMQIFRNEDAQIHLWALLAPFLFVALPFMALVAALAVLFECIRWLRGSLGNVVYFFLFILGITFVAIMLGVEMPLLDWLGFGIFKSSMAQAAKAAYPDYAGGLSLGLVPAKGVIRPFLWNGVDWTLPVILLRLLTLVWALGLVLLGALFFDRFDSAPARARSRRGAVSPDTRTDAPAQPSVPRSQLTPLPANRPGLRFGGLLLAELRLLLKGLAWWWLLGAAGLAAASLFVPLDALRSAILPACLVWPLLLWSKLGCRETAHNTRQIVFSAPHPLRGQLPAAWLAGLALAVLISAGAILRFVFAAETAALISLLTGLLFIPSLALGLGVWSGSGKAFEVIYVLIWYLGPLNKVLELDYLGLYNPAAWPAYLLLSGVLILLALAGRRRQLHV